MFPVPPPKCSLRTLQMELAPRRVHLLPLVEPLVLPELRVEGALLEPPHFERKSRSQFLKTRRRLLLPRGFVRFPPLFEYVAMMPHEDVISLIVKRRHLPPLKLSVVRKQAPEEPSGPMSQPRRESVQYQLRYVRARSAFERHVVRAHHVRHLEERRRSALPLGRIGVPRPGSRRGRRGTQVRYYHPVAHLGLFAQNNEVREIAVGRVRANVLHAVLSPGVIVQPGEEPHEISDKVKQFRRGRGAGRDYNLRPDLVREVRREFVLGLVGRHLVVVGADGRRLGLPGALEGAGLLLRRLLPVFPQGVGLLGPPESQFLLPLPLVLEVAAVHLRSLQLVPNVAGISRHGTFLRDGSRRVDGLLALKAGVGG
mmetsp:Transcript_43599/g.132688  ORF Transcript_43599/g.132688 Transcript_43599/m.132688 type:complete len:369 (+) Transcript_43599:480-1586(+)